MSQEIILKRGKDDYGIKDIKTLEGMEAIRLRPGMFIGSTGLMELNILLLKLFQTQLMNI